MKINHDVDSFEKLRYKLLRAAEVGDKPTLLLCLGQGAAVDTCDDEGLTLLHLAAREGHLDVVQELLRKGARINQESIGTDGQQSTRKTPLYMAVSAGHKDVVNYLVENEADINVRDADGFTLLHVANTADIVQILMNKGLDVNLHDRQARTPLHTANNVEVARALIKAGADIRAQDNFGRTPLDTAQQNDNTKLIRYLEQLKS